jgi:hypothetical protein
LVPRRKKEQYNITTLGLPELGEHLIPELVGFAVLFVVEPYWKPQLEKVYVPELVDVIETISGATADAVSEINLQLLILSHVAEPLNFNTF